MRTYFTVDSYPGQRFSGEIRQIRNAATTIQNVVTYDAVIDVPNDDLRLRPGMTANVTVVYDERKDVLVVANTALRFRAPPSLAGSSSAGGGGHRRPHGAGSASAGRGDPGDAPDGKPDGKGPPKPEAKPIWVLRGTTASQVTVHTGLSDGTITEVLDGLAEGDQVIVDTLSADGSAPSSTSTSVRRLF
jgi:HlyD family secretion protein